MFMYSVEGIGVKTKVSTKCDECGSIFLRTIEYTKASRKKRNSNKDHCRKCSGIKGATKRPQNSKQFWEQNKQSVAYYEGIKNRPSLQGENNPMWGKTFSDSSKARRSQIWRQRVGEKATNWKGGKLSLNRRLKGILQSRYRWFHRVIERDGCCQHCGATKQLDAHHIKPLSLIITELLERCDVELLESNKIDWLIIQPEVVDSELTNGITLCRFCHKKIHQNWGSHEPKVL